MPIRVEVYTATGVLSGVITRPGRLHDILASEEPLAVERGSVDGVDGVRTFSATDVPADDILVVVADDEADTPVHATWHAVRLRAGPFVVEGEMPTQPGFDPGRALTRPSGPFVTLRDVRITLVDRPDGGEVTHDRAMVNRYAVDEVVSSLELGFFFPGAHVPPRPAV